MFHQRLSNGFASGRKQQTAVKQTVERPKPKISSQQSISYRTHPYSLSASSVISNHRSLHEDDHWLKPPTKTFDDTPELDLVCQEETLSEAQLQTYPTQAYDPTAPLPLPAVRKRTSVIKKLTTQDIEILQDADEDFVPSESEDDDDDENYLPEHDRRPYHRSSHVNSTIGRGRGRGGRAHLTSTSARLPPSTHFVRPQPEAHPRPPSQSHSSTSSINPRRATSLEIELERTYASVLPRYYGIRNGQSPNSSDYGDFRIKCSICGEQSSNNMSFVAHLCSHFEDDLNYISPFDRVYRQCPVCQEEFSSPFQTFLHQDQEHMLELNEFPCRICQENHSNLVDLIAHLNGIHAGLDMPYHCDRCNYRSSMYEDLADHIRQVHQSTPYFFCPYCFQSVYLPTISDTNILNSTPAVRHVILHFDRIENSNSTKPQQQQQQQQRRIESLFKYCNRCLLHVKSLKEHSTYHHVLDANLDGRKSFLNDEENGYKRDHSQPNNESSLHRNSFLAFNYGLNRMKQLPVATIRRRPTTSNHYEPIPLNNRWHTRR